jgi:hypothetical protein
MREFRERGIYVAPNGQSFVASRKREPTSDGGKILSRLGGKLCCYLFGRYEWAFHGTPDFEVETTGNILPLKQTPDRPLPRQCSVWQIDELVDTGATAGSH